jgi:co-chaperonin GroES (HSP10)
MSEDSFEHPADWYDNMPIPIYWRVLVRPLVSKKYSKGGIALPVQSQDDQDTLNYIGQIMAMGALAGKHERLSGEPRAPQLGEWVGYGRYAGQVITFKNEKLLVLNDDEILCIVPDPDALKIYA